MTPFPFIRLLSSKIDSAISQLELIYRSQVETQLTCSDIQTITTLIQMLLHQDLYQQSPESSALSSLRQCYDLRVYEELGSIHFLRFGRVRNGGAWIDLL
jgi:hypothetical protein